jgi:hypothetical protein
VKLLISWKPAVAAIVLATVGGLTVWLWSCYYSLNESDYGSPPRTQSTNLNADLKLMWRTSGRVSTPEAIKAAERVFATVELVGLKRDEVIDLLGDARTASDSYNSNVPFYPTKRSDLVYRFDNGAFGCQYNVKFGWNGRVRRVQYLMIE